MKTNKLCNNIIIRLIEWNIYSNKCHKKLLFIINRQSVKVNVYFN